MMLSVRLALLYAGTFGIIGIQLPYWQLWLTGVGSAAGDGAADSLSMGQIGWLLGAAMWGKILANPLAGSLAGRMRDPRTLMFALALGGIGVHLAFGVSTSFPLLMVLSFLTGVTLGPHVPLGDHLVMEYVRRDGLDYGRLRLWGSLAFIATSTLLGLFLPDMPGGEEAVAPILWAMLGMTGLLALFCLLLPPPLPPADETSADEGATDGLKCEADARIPPFLLWMLLACGLSQMSHAVYYGFASVHWRDLGISGDWIGLLWAEGVLAEVLLFITAGFFVRKLGITGLLICAGAGGIVRWTCMAWAESLFMLGLLQILHALTFGAAHLAAIHAIAYHAPQRKRAALQGWNSALFITLTGVIGLPLSGWLFESFSAIAFTVAAVPSFVCLSISLILQLRNVSVCKKQISF